MSEYDYTNSSKAQFVPPPAAAAAGKRALEMKKKGHKWGTPVGWKRASQFANRTAMSLTTVRRVKAYFDRHQVDKKGKDWNNKANPSKGKLAWWGWGGDSAYSWAKGIVRKADSAKEKASISTVVASFIQKQRETAAPNMYAECPVQNGKEIYAWSSALCNFPIPANKLHCTIMYSTADVNLSMLKAGRRIVLAPNSNRQLKKLGDATALVFDENEARYLKELWQMCIDAGASWDFPSFIPHISISYEWKIQQHELDKIKPYSGRVAFGPYITKPLED